MTSKKGLMAGAGELMAMSSSLSIGGSCPPLPEQVFASSSLTLTHKSTGLRLRFCAAGALAAWRAAHAATPAAAAAVSPTSFDWTYHDYEYDGEVTDVSGAVVASCGEVADVGNCVGGCAGLGYCSGDCAHGHMTCIRRAPACAALPDTLLRDRRAPILFFAAAPLLADDLHDRGCSELTVKLRVMPTVLLVLLRSYLRLDGGVVRVRDVRYCSLLDGSCTGGARLLKSVTLRAAPDAVLRARLGRPPVRSRAALLQLAAASDDQDCGRGAAPAQGLDADEAYAALCTGEPGIDPEPPVANVLYELRAAGSPRTLAM